MGGTPNPCVQCNKTMKFGKLADLAKAEGLEKIATGHYARIAKDANGEQNELVIIFNPNAEATTVALPEGSWEIHINGEGAGLDVLATAEGTVEVAPISAMVLVQPGEVPVPTEPVVADPVPKGNDNLWLACAAIGLICGAGCGVLLKRKK